MVCGALAKLGMWSLTDLEIYYWQLVDPFRAPMIGKPSIARWGRTMLIQVNLDIGYCFYRVDKRL